MKLIRSPRRQVNRLLLLCGLIASVAVLGVGLHRYHSYTMRMWRGEYELAMTKVGYPDEVEDPDAADLAMMSKNSDDAMIRAVMRYQRGVDYVVGDRTYAAYDYAKLLYDEGDWKGAQKALQRAYMRCADDQGQVRPEYRKLASAIKVLCGHCLVELHKEGDSVPEYEEAIRLNPNNEVAIYEMERRKNASGGGEGDKGDKPKPSGAPSVRKKI